MKHNNGWQEAMNAANDFAKSARIRCRVSGVLNPATWKWNYYPMPIKRSR